MYILMSAEEIPFLLLGRSSVSVFHYSTLVAPCQHFFAYYFCCSILMFIYVLHYAESKVNLTNSAAREQHSLNKNKLLIVRYIATIHFLYGVALSVLFPKSASMILICSKNPSSHLNFSCFCYIIIIHIFLEVL